MSKKIAVFDARVMFKFPKTFGNFKGIKWEDDEHTRGKIQTRNEKGHFGPKVPVKVY